MFFRTAIVIYRISSLSHSSPAGDFVSESWGRSVKNFWWCLFWEFCPRTKRKFLPENKLNFKDIWWLYTHIILVVIDRVIWNVFTQLFTIYRFNCNYYYWQIQHWLHKTTYFFALLKMVSILGWLISFEAWVLGLLFLATTFLVDSTGGPSKAWISFLKWPLWNVSIEWKTTSISF